MKEFMKLCWIEYPNDKKHIDTDERFLINGLKPLLNIKNNPNALAASKDNPTKHYKKRRVEIVAKSKSKLNCKKETKTIKKTKNPDDNTPLFAENIITTFENGCVEYIVLQGQDIGEVTRGIEGLPTGKCSIEIYDSNDILKIFDLYNIRFTGNNENPNSQNIYTYFDTTCSERLFHIGKYKKEIIKYWMKENKIEEITIKVCPIKN
jgi:hypothetical protein